MNAIAPRESSNYALGLFRKFGIAGTLFFLVKGLLWLIVPLVIAKGL